MKVTVYSTPVCPYCVMVKDFLKKHKIGFEDVDVSKDRSRADEMIRKSGGMAVPVIVINKDGSEKVIIGFNKPALEKALGL